jgi:hypothetical protein
MRLFALTLVASAMILPSPDQQDWMDTKIPTTRWLGLFDHELKPVTVRAISEKSIEVKPREPRMILRDIPGVTAGPVREATYDGYSIDVKQPFTIRFRGEKFELRRDAKNRVTLHHGKQTQELFAKPEFVDEEHFEVIWAGDLDRDGKLDLITVLSPKYSWYPYDVWLSSKAAHGEIVHRVARYDHFSC